MIPGIDPRQLKHMMKQMGMSQEDISAKRVVIETESKNIVIENPSVQKVVMQGQTSFQISGTVSETAEAETSDLQNESFEISLSDEDIKTVAETAKVTPSEAKEELLKTKGDIAEAILNLQKNGN